VSATHARPGRCGCCAPIAPMTPLPLGARPGLAEVPYRVGTWASFRRSMLDRVTPIAERLAIEEGLSAIPLDRWTTDADDDYGRVLLGLWASVLDVLAFHTERYAQDAWLRTADDPAALRRLAGLLGYRPSPGSNAAGNVVVTLEDGVDLVLPARLRVQSTPADGQTPQVFETTSPLVAASALNAVAVFAVAEPVDPLAAGRGSITLPAGVRSPRPGARILLFDASHVDERDVASLEDRDGRAVVHFSRPLGRNASEAWLADRTFRLAGADAPASWVETAPISGSNFLAMQPKELTTGLSGVSSLTLAGTVPLEVGSDVLVVHGGTTGAVTRRTVTDVSPTTWTGAGQVQEATAVGLDGSVDVDLRTTVVHVLLEPLVPSTWELGAGIPSGTEEVVVPPTVGPLTRGRTVLFDDRAGDPVLATLATDATPYVPPGADGPSGHLLLRLAAPLPRSLAPGAVLRGNVVRVDHGETVVEEVLGDGDRTARFPSFPLAKDPLTHVVDAAAAGGVRPELELEVSGVRWHRRDLLLGAGPDERVYEVRHDVDGTAVVRFGDGRTGALLPSGRANLTATYRRGLGVAGRLAAGQLETALDRPTGLDTVVNPLPTTGGSDPDGPEDVRQHVPATVRTFDRAVSLTDLADLAVELPTVAKARATWVWDGVERVAVVTVVGHDATVLSSRDRLDLQTFLDARRDVNRPLRLVDAELVPLELELQVDVHDDHRASVVRTQVEAALLGWLSPAAGSLGRPINLSDTYATVHGVDGVVAARITTMRERDLADRIRHGTTTPTRPRLPVGGATHAPMVPGGIRGAELAWLASADLDVQVLGGRPDAEEGP
jgi:hypothetical protein